MKAALLALVFLGLVWQAVGQATTTDFCSDAFECCGITAICLKYVNENRTETGSTGTGIFSSCPHPTCPLGWNLQSNKCVRVDTVVYSPTGPLNPFGSIAACLQVISGVPQSYHTRHCIEGLMQTKRACLFNLGLKG